MAAMTVYNAFSLPRFAPAKPSITTLPASVPLQKPFASQRKLQSLAFNPAIDSVGFRATSPLPFIRPDVPPETEEGVQAARARAAEATAEASFKARPQFRSALEQVSYVTNNKLWDARKQEGPQRTQQRARLGIFGF